MNIVNKLTIKHLKQNKKRTLVTIIGVIISVAMIMGVATIGVSFSDLMKRREISTSGNWHVEYKDVTKDQIKSIKQDSNTDKTIISKDLGYARLNGSKNENKPYVFIKEFNNEGFKNNPVQIIKGRLPKSPGEVVISNHISSNAKVYYNLGDVLNLDIGNRYEVPKIGEEKGDMAPLDQNTVYLNYEGAKENIIPTLKKEYRIVGIIDRPKFEQNWAPGYTILSYIDENILKPDEKVKASVVLKKLGMSIYKDSEKFAKVNGIKDIQLNSSLLKWSGVITEGGIREALYGVIIIIIAIIIIGSVSLIYNAFAISVSERGRYLGMLSSVGATKKQKRNSVIFEAAIIGLISIPIGIIAGIAGMGVTFIFAGPIIQGAMDITDSLQLVVNPFSIIATVILSGITIYISAFIPAIRASKISPIEAIRQTKDIKLTNKSVKTSKLTRKIFGIEAEIGLKNLKRNKRRYLTTVFSLVVSIVLFLTVSTFSTYMKKSIEIYKDGVDYDIQVSALISNINEKENIYKRFTSIEGIKDYTIIKSTNLTTFIETSKISDFVDKTDSVKKDGKYSFGVNITCLNKEAFNKYAKEVGANIDKLSNKEVPSAIVINATKYFDDKNKKFVQEKIISQEDGDKLSLVEGNESNNYKPIKDIKIEKLTSRLPMGMSYDGKAAYFNIVVSEDVFNGILNNVSDKKLALDNAARNSILNMTSDDAFKVQDKIEEIQKGVDENVYVYNVSESKQRDDQMQMLFSIFLYGFIALITAISVANIFNTISTSIGLRKKEFAMLKSVGMTPRDFNKMINYESIFYGIKSLGYGLPISFLIMILLHKTLIKGFSISFIIPWVSVIIAIVAVFGIVTLTMLYSISKVKKENIIDALKQENI